jgi:hypothetical protein
VLTRGAHSGIGEGAPASDAKKFTQEIAGLLTDAADLAQYRKIVGRVHAAIPDQWALKSAVTV